MLVAQPTWTQVSQTQTAQPVADIPRLNQIKQPLTSVEGLLVQQPAPTQTQVAQVTAVQLKPTDKGLEVILETTGTFAEVLTSSSGNSLITDIPNAQLRLLGGGDFRKDNPTDAISSVTVENLGPNQIRATLTGKAGVPTAEVSQSSQALILSVAAPPAPASQPTPAPTAPPPAEPDQEPEPQAEEEEPLELTVTAEREAEGYSVPNATTGTRTDTPLRDIPLSIQVVPQAVIEDRNVTELGDALETIGGVVSAGQRGTSVFGPGFLIRGFDVADSIFRDGIPYFSLAPLSTNDIERVEVLKGPASVLFGQGEPGGIINLISKKPLAEPFYSVSFG